MGLKRRKKNSGEELKKVKSISGYDKKRPIFGYVQKYRIHEGVLDKIDEMADYHYLTRESIVQIACYFFTKVDDEERNEFIRSMKVIRGMVEVPKKDPE